jgi:hypothetical protein
MEPTREPSERPASWADAQLASLVEGHPHWDVWYVRSLAPGSGLTWCARPAGAATATCHGGKPAELTEAIVEFVGALPEKIDEARAELGRTPVSEKGRRGVLEKQLSALALLFRSVQVLPP